MREILFRGKRTDGNGWALGVAFSYQRDDGDERAVIIQQFAPLSKSVDCVPVDPSSVGQYTGLKDRNGKRIFDGDILDYINADGELIGRPCVVRFGEYNCNCCDGVYGWVCDGGCGDIRDFEGCEECGPYQVIGNIHDNADLLK